MAKKQQLKYKRNKNGKYGFVDNHRKWIIAPQFDFASNFEDGIAKVKLNSKYGFIKTDGTYLFEPQFDNASYFEDGIAKVELNSKYGFIKTDCSYLFEPQFDYASNFEDGIAQITINDKYGFIKNDGTVIAKPQFDKVKDFEDGYAPVQLNDKWFELGVDGTIHELDKIKTYVLICHDMQNEDCPGWSFLEASVKNGKWVFNSWARLMGDNDDVDEEPEIRYYDETEENKAFAKWANSLNLSTPKEVGELLWANAQQLIDYAKIEQVVGGQGSPMRDLTILIQLYWQLKNIEELGLQDVRTSLDLPQEEELYLSSQNVKKKAVKFCARLLCAKWWDYEYLDFIDLTEKSHTPGRYHYVSDNYEDQGVENEEDWGDLDDWDNDEEDEWNEEEDDEEEDE